MRWLFGQLLQRNWQERQWSIEGMWIALLERKCMPLEQERELELRDRDANWLFPLRYEMLSQYNIPGSSLSNVIVQGLADAAAEETHWTYNVSFTQDDILVKSRQKIATTVNVEISGPVSLENTA